MLSWDVAPDRVVLVVEAALSAEHPLAGPPRIGDQHRYETIDICFDGLTDMRFLASGAAPGHDATGEADWGNIASFRIENGHRYILEGMIFGDLDFIARECRIIPRSRSWEN